MLYHSFALSFLICNFLRLVHGDHIGGKLDASVDNALHQTGAASVANSQQQNADRVYFRDSEREAIVNESPSLSSNKVHPSSQSSRYPSLPADSPRASWTDEVKPGNCRIRKLTMCNSILPYRQTVFPNIVGDYDYDSVNRSMLFFSLMLKDDCNIRMNQFVCALLEPPCRHGRPVVPCRKFCKVAIDGCQKFIPATLAMSRVFDCSRYPDSSDLNVCVNLARNQACLRHEYQCPDQTCIPQKWKCDGVRDCIFAADEANCTACNEEEFQCDFRCIPKTWRCDGETDCKDGTDEKNCPPKPVCGPDRFLCNDGSGCFPKRWVCDGKAECRDGSDEKDCGKKQCTGGDFRCDNGICIPPIWRCDGQNDCKDNSDEKRCGTYDAVLPPQVPQNHRMADGIR